MNGIGGWFRQMTTKLGAGLRRFMEGRYGSDKLGIFMLRVALVLMVIDLFLPAGLIKLVMWILAYGLMIFPAMLKKKLGRWQGIVLLGIYAAFVGCQFVLSR